MNQETIKAIQEALTPIANKIGQGAEFGWEVVVRQQEVVAWTGVFFVVLGLILALVLYKFLAFTIRKHKENTRGDWGIIGSFVGFFGVIAVGVLVIGGAYDAITHFLNPEYYALEFFMNLVK